MMQVHRRDALIGLALGLPFAGLMAQPGRRAHALVVGNGAYPRVPLRNAVADARAVDAALQSLDFRVTRHENLDWDELIAALQRFTQDAPRHDVRLFYYAGHGMQVDGRNYLNPVGAAPADTRGLRSEAVELDDLVVTLSRIPYGVSIVIVDACRNNPFLAHELRTRSGSSAAGIARRMAPRGVVLAFSTGPEGVAEDGAARHSTFTHHLLRHMEEPGLPIEETLKRVRLAVHESTRHAQQPWVSTNLIGEFCLRPRADGTCGG